MAQIVREVKERSVEDDDTVNTIEPTARSEYTMTVLERIIYYIGGIITVVIALRILLSLLGANRGNAFASFVSNNFHATFLWNYLHRTDPGTIRNRIYEACF